MPWFMDCLSRGRFKLVNPYNGRVRVFEANPATVHTIVFWSKDYRQFLTQGCGAALQQWGYNLFFHFTINSAAPDFEPCLPPLKARVGQLAGLCRRFGAERINWRFDPIFFYRATESAEIRDNLDDFETIATAAAKLGIVRCTTSFVDLYPKVKRRAAAWGMEFVTPSAQKQRQVLTMMAGYLAPLGIEFVTCCEEAVHAKEPAVAGVKSAACIDHHLLRALGGSGLSCRRDRGQRIKQGCGCHESVDVGDYRHHPCHHGCLFCYANPVVSQPVIGGQEDGEGSAI
jgi:hypothetical protein